jgi:polysaccharide deacetylase family protein (PEP-CTERM system associated)
MERMVNLPLSSKRHLLTVALEDYYQVGAFNRLIQRGQWYRFENRLERSTMRTLDLLDAYGIKATFFVLGWVGEIVPQLVRTVAERGHEIASKGYYHRSISSMTPSEFRDDLARARSALESASRTRILGYRVADGWFSPADLWALDILAAEGYEYDSSIAPLFRRFRAEPWRRFVHSHHFGERVLWEFPISSTEILGWAVPFAGGNYIRQLPQWLVRRETARWDQRYTAPLVMYFHTWELDPDQPRINAAPWHTRVRQYRNLDRMEPTLRYYFENYRLSGIADSLGLSTVPSLRRETETPRPAEPVKTVAPVSGAGGRVPVTVVVPCYNEELILPYLANTLESVQSRLGASYDLRFIFVDDRSTDGTWQSLSRIFGGRPNCTFVRHQRNKGVAGAIMTGIRQSKTEIVCSIDCDCTYDPHELERMIPLLADGDLVTASPYHPEGQVHNVPRWRLLLSSRLSAAYRMVLRRNHYTWTSCFRVYRKSSALAIQLTRGGFLGVAELMAMLVVKGGRITEYPATLEVRMLGRSKMKIIRTILGHLNLLRQLALIRILNRAEAKQVPSDTTSTPVPAPRIPASR